MDVAAKKGKAEGQFQGGMGKARVHPGQGKGQRPDGNAENCSTQGKGMAKGIQGLAVDGFITFFVPHHEGFFGKMVVVVHVVLDFLQIFPVDEFDPHGGEISQDKT